MSEDDTAGCEQHDAFDAIDEIAGWDPAADDPAGDALVADGADWLDPFRDDEPVLVDVDVGPGEFSIELAEGGLITDGAWADADLLAEPEALPAGDGDLGVLFDDAGIDDLARSMWTDIGDGEAPEPAAVFRAVLDRSDDSTARSVASTMLGLLE
ncbi:hypothetical protein BH20ACT4_BH20ACT4_04110 [soil metagenome]